MKNLVSTLFMSFFSLAIFSQSSFGEIVGKVFESESDDTPAFDATVWVEQSGSKMRAKVDMDGRFRISAVPPGKYKLHAVYLGDSLPNPPYIEVKPDGITNIGEMFILDRVQMADVVEIVAELDPLIDFGDVGISRISSKDIALSPVRNDAKQLIVSYNSEIKMDNNGELMIRGARAGDLVYFIDGVKMNDVKSIPSVAINGVAVYSSAIPAKYGDTTGGVIIMESKSYTDLYRERKMMMHKKDKAQKK